MKKIMLICLGLLLIGIAYLAIEGRKVQEIRTEIEISASPEKVWDILVDINGWQEWSPIIKKSSGSVSNGAKLDIVMMGKEPGSSGPKYSPVIIELNRPKYFQWRAHMIAGFIFTNDKIFELQATETGTLLIHKETFKGLLAPVFCGQMEKGVTPMLNSMNKALKALAEK